MFVNIFYFLRKIVQLFVRLDRNIFIKILNTIFIQFSVIWFDRNNVGLIF